MARIPHIDTLFADLGKPFDPDATQPITPPSRCYEMERPPWMRRGEDVYIALRRQWIQREGITRIIRARWLNYGRPF